MKKLLIKFLSKSSIIILLILINCLITKIIAKTYIFENDCKNSICRNINFEKTDHLRSKTREIIQTNTLKFENSSIPILNRKLFKHFTNLTEIDLRNSNISEYDMYSFFRTPNLQILLLSSNNLIELPPTGFLLAEELQYLWIDDNQIEKLSKNSFANLLKLRYLSLESNFISELPKGVFDPLINLNGIYLRNNQLEILENGIFDKNEQLEIIVLKENQIKKIGENIFRNIRSINFLEISENFIEKFEINVNNINQLNAINSEIKKIQINGIIRSTNLQNNQINDIFLDHPESVQLLNLQNNSIKNIDFLRYFVNLQNLDLSGNQIPYLSSYPFKLMENIRELNLSSSEIQEIDNMIFDSMIFLEKLDISNNYIQSINMDMIDQLENLRDFNFRNNPNLNCNQLQEVFEEFIQKNSIVYSSDPRREDETENDEKVYGIYCGGDYTPKTNEKFNYIKEMKILKNEFNIITKFHQEKLEKLMNELKELKRRQNITAHQDNEKFWEKSVIST